MKILASNLNLKYWWIVTELSVIVESRKKNNPWELWKAKKTRSSCNKPNAMNKFEEEFDCFKTEKKKHAIKSQFSWIDLCVTLAKRGFQINVFLISRQNITKTYLYHFDPYKPHFYVVKLGFTGVYIIFLISTQKHRLWVLVRIASAQKHRLCVRWF